MQQLLPVGQSVRLRAIDTDKYDRLVAEVYVNNRSVNLKMVEEGMAVVYRRYLSGCKNTANQFLQSEARAKQNNLAFWHQSHPVMPHIARKSKYSLYQFTKILIHIYRRNAYTQVHDLYHQ